MVPFIILYLSVLGVVSEAAERLSGLVWVEHAALGSKSEGPVYRLQTCDSDHELSKNADPWEIDYHLDFYSRKMVEVRPDGSIHKIPADRIPCTSRRRAQNKITRTQKIHTDRRLRRRNVKMEGLVYVKHGRVGTRSEGPDYFLQTNCNYQDVRYRLKYNQPEKWNPDHYLEYFDRRVVRVIGKLSPRGRNIIVESIEMITSTSLPNNCQE